MTREALENTSDYQCEMGLLYQKREASIIVSKLMSIKERIIAFQDTTEMLDTALDDIDSAVEKLEHYKKNVKCEHHHG